MERCPRRGQSERPRAPGPGIDPEAQEPADGVPGSEGTWGVNGEGGKEGGAGRATEKGKQRGRGTEGSRGE